jgi:FkbM family methyltransferase
MTMAWSGTEEILEKLQWGYKHSPRVVRKTLRAFRDIGADSYNRRHFDRIVQSTAAQIIKDAQSHPGKKVFVDCGFNAGEMLERFVNALPDFRFYGFEVNCQYFAERAAELQKRYSNIVSLNFSAVWDHDGTASFRIAGQRRGMLRGEATTILSDFHQKQSESFEAEIIEARSKKVPAIDFSRWLKETVARHTEPDGPKPFVVVKMDIEGAEYAVLEKLLHDGTITLVSKLMVEFHTHQFDQNQRPYYARREVGIREKLSRFPVQILSWG